MSPSASKQPYLNFLLAPTDARLFVKSARLSKSRKKHGAGEVFAEQNFYIAFRTKSRDDFETWVRVLRQLGVVRNRAAITFYKAISRKTYLGGKTRDQRFRLLSPSFSYPASFSHDEGGGEGVDVATEETSGSKEEVRQVSGGLTEALLSKAPAQAIALA